MNEREIFIEALQKTDTAARQAYLHQACGGDDALRQRVEELLNMLEQAGSFLEAPPAVPGTTDAPEAPPDAEEAGSRIGPYKLVQKLG